MQTTALSDAQLVLASAADATVFGQVFDRHARTVFRFASRRVGSEVAKDVTAETFSIAFERRARSILIEVLYCPGCSGSQRTWSGITAVPSDDS